MYNTLDYILLLTVNPAPTLLARFKYNQQVAAHVCTETNGRIGVLARVYTETETNDKIGEILLHLRLLLLSIDMDCNQAVRIVIS